MGRIEWCAFEDRGVREVGTPSRGPVVGRNPDIGALRGRSVYPAA